jgi:hypothetical protein
MPEFTHIVESDSLPVIELDTEAQAAYVRFRQGKVARTRRVQSRTVGSYAGSRLGWQHSRA